MEFIEKPSLTKKPNRPVIPKRISTQKDEGLLLVKVKGVGNIPSETLSEIRKGIKKQMEEGLIVYPEQTLEIKHVCNCSDVKIKKGE